MAKQESFIKLRGKMGDLSFYKHRRSGYQARMKGGVDSQRIASDPAFQRTRENNAEFGRAASTSKKIRQQLSNLLFYYGDSTLSNRLNSRVHQIQKADTVNPRGQRTFLQEHAGMLKGFQMREKISKTHKCKHLLRWRKSIFLIINDKLPANKYNYLLNI